MAPDSLILGMSHPGGRQTSPVIELATQDLHTTSSSSTSSGTSSSSASRAERGWWQKVSLSTWRFMLQHRSSADVCLHTLISRHDIYKLTRWLNAGRRQLCASYHALAVTKMGDVGYGPYQLLGCMDCR